VQDFGLQMLIYAEEIQHTKEDLELFKRTLVASGKYDASLLYEDPQKKTTSDVDINDPDASYDFTDVEWSVPSIEEFTNFADIQEAMANTSVILSGDTEEIYGEWT
jgi:hypothetical protein